MNTPTLKQWNEAKPYQRQDWTWPIEILEILK